MNGCPSCGFLSDTRTGDIYDSRFPCPQCGVRASDVKRIKVTPQIEQGFGETSFLSKFTSLAKITACGFAFFYSRIQIAKIENGDSDAYRVLKRKLGDLTPAMKKSTWYIPTLAAPSVVTLLTNEEWPVLGTVFTLLIWAMIGKTITAPIREAYKPVSA